MILLRATPGYRHLALQPTHTVHAFRNKPIIEQDRWVDPITNDPVDVTMDLTPSQYDWLSNQRWRHTYNTIADLPTYHSDDYYDGYSFLALQPDGTKIKFKKLPSLDNSLERWVETEGGNDVTYDGDYTHFGFDYWKDSLTRIEPENLPSIKLEGDSQEYKFLAKDPDGSYHKFTQEPTFFGGKWRGHDNTTVAFWRIKDPERLQSMSETLPMYTLHRIVEASLIDVAREVLSHPPVMHIAHGGKAYVVREHAPSSLQTPAATLIHNGKVYEVIENPVVR